MDEGTRHVLFESMRRRPRGNAGGYVSPQRRGANTNRKLFLQHQQLEKQCTATIRKHQSDNKLFQAQLHCQRHQMVRVKDRLDRDRKYLERETIRRHNILGTFHTNLPTKNLLHNKLPEQPWNHPKPKPATVTFESNTHDTY